MNTRHGPTRTAVALSSLTLSLVVTLVLGPATDVASAQTTFGTLSNFDVFNDTGQEVHGFEIELDGISSSDITYTFGSPYQRYGNPAVVDFAGGVYVRYTSPYDPAAGTFTQTTPLAPAVITPTDGHACWTGGSAGYLTSGCEHFGVGLARNPTATVYRWLIADPTTPGALQPSGTKVSIPAPIWNVAPPPAGGQAPVVQAALPAEPPEVEGQYGNAMWVKVFVTEAAEHARLEHLVTDDPAVPQASSETEVEWAILQSSPDGANSELASEGQMGAGNKSVTRRYEFYQYTGAYDPESHEVMCGGDGSCDVPGPGELGNYIGAQIAAVNVGDILVGLAVEHHVLPVGEVGAPYGAKLVTGGNPPYDITVLTGTLPAGLAINPDDGTLAGLPLTASSDAIKFRIRAADQLGAAVTGRFSIARIRDALTVKTARLPAGTQGEDYSARLVASGGKYPRTWSVVAGDMPPGLALDSATGAITGMPGARGTFALTFGVVDPLGGQAQQSLTIRVR